MWFWRRRLLYFRYFVIISLLETVWRPSYEQTWIPITPKWFNRAKFGWNWPIDSWEKDLHIVNECSLFRHSLPLEKGGALLMNKLESPLTKDSLCQVWVKSGPFVLKKTISKFRKCIFTVSLLSPPPPGRGPLLEQTWVPIIQGCFVPILVEIGLVVLEKKILDLRYFCYNLTLEKDGPGTSFPFYPTCFVQNLVTCKMTQWGRNV